MAFIALAASGARAQLSLPTAAPPPDGASLFRNQCATCHTLNPADPPRQGPLLKGVIGRPPGSVAGFKYSPGYARADWVWDETHLDAYLANPQATIPGSNMLYRQANPDVRRRIVAYLKDQP